MNELLRKQWASAKNNGDFICIETYSGRGSTVRDPAGKQVLLAPDASDDTLGAAVLDALAASRLLSLEEIGSLFELTAVKERHDEWVAALMKKYGYKARRALLKNMRSCDIECRGGEIILIPTRHERLEGWGREKDDGIQNISVPALSSSAAVGAALRLAFERCL